MEGKIYEAISNVMADIGAVGKNNTNQFDKYKFRGIDDVMNALYPAMVKNHVFVTPEVLEAQREERASKDGKTMMYTILTIKYTFYTDDGSHVKCTVVGEAMDRSDKSTNKAMSAGFKYACFQTFCIPTEELIDSETESPEVGNAVTVTKKKADKTDEQKNEDPNLVPKSNELVTENQLNMIRAELERTGVTEKQVLDLAKVDSLDKMHQTTAVSIYNKLKKTPSVKGN